MLESIKSPQDIKNCDLNALNALCGEIRNEIIKCVSENGGHLASSLGAVELVVATHYVYDAPKDKILFDVGHQAYAHKLLTGRLDTFSTLRKEGGISGFLSPFESEYDCVVTGHASSAISLGTGFARARDLKGSDHKVVTIVGDGALTGGMCYEALNDLGQSRTPMVIILNDNKMSISQNVGAISQHLTNIRQSSFYRGLKQKVRGALSPSSKKTRVYKIAERMRNSVKALLMDKNFFDTLGIEYVGPIDGHDLKTLIKVLNKAKEVNGPVIIHAVTRKGQGYKPAAEKPDEYHGVAPFFVDTGEPQKTSGGVSNGKVAADTLIRLANADSRVSVVCAAMPGGTNMNLFANAHPNKFFDVGIAEGHAVSMAAGMASGGLKPYVCIYSTFLQRAYDQIITDVCINNLPVTFLMDRSGLVGADGITHQGVYDLSYLRQMPNMAVCSPRDRHELERMIEFSLNYKGPLAIRYQKDSIEIEDSLSGQDELKLGKWEILTEGNDVMIFAVGQMVKNALEASRLLASYNVSAGVCDARFIKPLDANVIKSCASRGLKIITIEENTLLGGFGSYVNEFMTQNNLGKVDLSLGVPDEFIMHGSIKAQELKCGLDPNSIANKIKALSVKINQQ